MKKLFVLILLVYGSVMANAQTVKSHSSKNTAQQRRGSGRYYGSKDTTPGSPMGTGGAGGEGMSGSPSGSASEDALHAAPVKNATAQAKGNQASKAKKLKSKKKTVHHTKRQM